MTQCFAEAFSRLRSANSSLPTRLAWCKSRKEHRPVFCVDVYFADVERVFE